MLRYSLVMNSGAEVETEWPDDSLLKAFQAAGSAAELSKVVLVCKRGDGAAVAIDVREVAVMKVEPARADDEGAGLNPSDN